MRRPAVILSGALAALTLSGCGSDADAGDADVLRVVTGNRAADEGEYRFDVRSPVEAGLHRLELVNDGDEAHHAQIFRLDDGSTVDDLTAALATGDPAGALDVGDFLGGTGLVSPGQRSRAEAVIHLEPGSYALICFVADAGGTPHLAHGMVEPFDVTGSAAAGSLPDPELDADHDIELVDYSFEMPATLDGDATVAVTNASPSERHEMIFLSVEEGVSAADVVEAFHDGTSLPGVGVGGMQALPPGATQHLQLDLEPGRYFVLCAVPSADGRPHLDAGMIEEVIVP
jgi:hypothetical protein